MENERKEQKEKYTRGWWVEEIKRAEKRLKTEWWDSADKVVKRYLDDREGDANDDAYRFNIFWANVGILKASLYANPPKPMVSRQFTDFDDDVARVAGEMLERLLSMDLQRERSDEHMAFRYAVEDRLIPGSGQLWYRYEVTTETATTAAVTDPYSGQELAPAQEYEKITDEQVECDHVNFKDFIWPAARTWEEVPWVARRIYLDEEKVEARFGEEKSKALMTEDTFNGTERRDVDAFKRGKGEIFEIWCKAPRRVYWVCLNGPDELLDDKDDFLQLPGFFPCPRPLLATVTTSDLLPRSDYSMVQDQYRELDELSERCVLLEKSLRVAGVYDSKNGAIKQLVNGARENTMIPVDNWAALSEAGGLKGVVDWLPIEVIAKVLGELTKQRLEKVQQIYELTGLSDIMRGASAPRETATAQSLKAQYSSVRLQYLQGEVAIFVQEALRIKSEIISRHFQPETILERSNVMKTPDAQMAQAAVQLLKSDLGKYKIEVNADSMAIPDYNTERAGRMEFMGMLGQFLEQVQPIMATLPQAGPFFLQLIQWCASSFRGSRQAEAILDQAIKAFQNAPPGPVEESGSGSNENDVAAAEQATAAEQAKAQGAVAAARAKAQGAAHASQAKTMEHAAKSKSDQQTAMVKAVAGLIQPPQPPTGSGGNQR